MQVGTGSCPGLSWRANPVGCAGRATQRVGQFSCRRFGSLVWSGGAVDRGRHGARVNCVGGEEAAGLVLRGHCHGSQWPGGSCPHRWGQTAAGFPSTTARWFAAWGPARRRIAPGGRPAWPLPRPAATGAQRWQAGSIPQRWRLPGGLCPAAGHSIGGLESLRRAVAGQAPAGQGMCSAHGYQCCGNPGAHSPARSPMAGPGGCGSLLSWAGLSLKFLAGLSIKIDCYLMRRGWLGRGWMAGGLDGLLVEPSVGAAVLGNQDNGNRAQNNSYI